MKTLAMETHPSLYQCLAEILDNMAHLHLDLPLVQAVGQLHDAAGTAGCQFARDPVHA